MVSKWPGEVDAGLGALLEAIYYGGICVMGPARGPEGGERDEERERERESPVSYTHLTLPTNREV